MDAVALDRLAQEAAVGVLRQHLVLAWWERRREWGCGWEESHSVVKRQWPEARRIQRGSLDVPAEAMGAVQCREAGVKVDFEIVGNARETDKSSAVATAVRSSSSCSAMQLTVQQQLQTGRSRCLQS